MAGEQEQGMENSCIYKNRNEPVEARIKDLISRMTVEEKIGQMTQIERVVATPSVVRKFFIGSVLSGGGSVLFEKALSSDWVDMVDGYQKAVLETPLGIPIIYGINAVHGNNNVYGATIFPHNIGLGATRDADLAYKIGVATALEVRASGVHYDFSPCVAVAGDPRWGRTYESYSEDVDIVRKMTSIVSGLQGQPPKGHPNGYPFVTGRNKVAACAKHFVGDGGTHKGINEGNTLTSYEDLEKIHTAPYLDCISQGVCTVMASYSSWNGDKMHSHKFLPTQVLKDKLGFKGFVISDWEALEGLSDPYGSNYRASISSAINAGVDMIMVPFKYEVFLADLMSLVESGEIPMARVDDAVERILRVKFVAGLFEYPMADRSLLDTVGCKLHKELAREAVRKSLVLLKNGKDPKKPLLPLDRILERFLLPELMLMILDISVEGGQLLGLGPVAEPPLVCAYYWQLCSFRKHFSSMLAGTTILDAVKEAVGDKTEVVFEQNPSPDTFAGQDISYAIVAVGEPPYVEGGGDDPNLIIPFRGSEIISSVAERVPILAILISGRP
ncbi:hypothetical protein RHMOL_Rhmol13G0088600 [Rhododendron molle]|uniref:Uncharacterized protein n=1 Tax=Rhododendron molle TaxID=49168 RepID=A0ACC0L5G5_RHOML|nr:hypothetical protein RHMOL_Rhmol13G0088600 [Rhododendron molle]